jgi:hypothetical protein
MSPQESDHGEIVHSAGHELYIMRPGVAAQVGHGTTDDLKRPLTTGGKKKLHEVARGLTRSGGEMLFPRSPEEQLLGARLCLPITPSVLKLLIFSSFNC